MRSLAVLGSTGSIGTQTLRVLQQNPGQYNVQLLCANSNWRLLEEQVRVFRPRWAVLADPGAAGELQARVRDVNVQVLTGEKALADLLASQGFDIVVAGMVGHAGLLPVIAAIQAGADIALANKEVLVMAGHLVTALCRQKGVSLLPLDSEHSAIFQCLQGHSSKDINKLILTASGGPFWGKSPDQLANVTPAQAVKHPNWKMGAKISVDSASLMNKGLEIIEASWLFGISPEKIDVLVHPQSIIHSMVEFRDGTVLAQLGVPSMELPIQFALSWPRRWPGPDSYFLDWLNLPSLSFSQPDTVAFPCLDLARAAIRKGGNAPAVLSTANDICVEYFLAGKLSFYGIPRVIEQMLAVVPWQADPDLSSILKTMESTIQETKNYIESME
ncbi:MAG: 1-deoxy-D-xylulose-5-phosphate reductoisomerase [Eubacteriales bacterium]|nr:1-deoxy-D-xylulose-5-phosphate reductoisomerase [Eubacteriales bacterium]